MWGWPMADLYRLMREDPRAVVDLIAGLVRAVSGERELSVDWGTAGGVTLYAGGSDKPTRLWVEPR